CNSLYKCLTICIVRPFYWSSSMYIDKEYKTPTILVVAITVENGFLGTVNVGIEDAEVNNQGEY
ncbi:MAG: hypothetical protein II282_04910, partial [Alistipes sp.]|nr:hypothetical protein [Alistipes sp.]